MDNMAVMKHLSDIFLAEARAAIAGGPEGSAAKALTITGWSPTGFTVQAGKPASYLIRGWDRKPMTWLLGKRVAFTPKNGGRRIVRRVTADSIARGHWVRPKRANQDVYGQAWGSPAFQEALAEVNPLWVVPLPGWRHKRAARWTAVINTEPAGYMSERAI